MERLHRAEIAWYRRWREWIVDDDVVNVLVEELFQFVVGTDQVPPLVNDSIDTIMIGKDVIPLDALGNAALSTVPRF